MKNVILIAIFFTIISCKNETNKTTQKEEKQIVKKENFPDELGKVFKTHGGIDTWRKVRILSFNKGDEVHTADLKSRKTVINHPEYSLGFDGTEVWLDEEKEGAFKNNPTFYYNLYFYFYAMPFVLADDGIIYEKVEEINFEGKTYPGIKISYKANVGTSPDDNYIIYYNPENFQMEWLAYTVTFKTKKPSDRYNILKYNKWENVNGLILPKEILWYKKDEKGNPTEPAGTPTVFTLPLVSQTNLADSFFEAPVK